MKTYFFINDCQQVQFDNQYVLKLESSLVNYIKKLEKKYVNGIHDFDDSRNIVCCIESFSDNYVKAQAYRLLSSQVDIDSYTSVHEFDFQIKIQNEMVKSPKALMYAYNTSGFVFSVPVIKELECNEFQILTGDCEKRVSNYFGNNYQYVIDLIEERRKESMSLLDKVKLDLPAKCLPRFEVDFEKLSNAEMSSIYELFEKVKSWGFRIQDKGKGIREVTQDKGKNKLFELKVFDPKPLRIYFGMQKKTIWIATFGTKTTQNNDISRSQYLLDSWDEFNAQ